MAAPYTLGECPGPSEPPHEIANVTSVKIAFMNLKPPAAAVV